MNPFKIRDAFFWKDQISVDSSYWASQRERVDKLEFIAGFQTAVLGALLVGLIVAAMRLQGVMFCIGVDNARAPKDDYYTTMSRKYQSSTKHTSDVNGVERGEVSASSYSF